MKIVARINLQIHITTHGLRLTEVGCTAMKEGLQCLTKCEINSNSKFIVMQPYIVTGAPDCILV